ncbi:MAG: DUF4134 domain-containing protein [Prevotellaceae bacterium]|jgi:hypothetical protein|nr:DUF4134 domain-containing protein [Prevotellaceae bacterium]
MKKIKTKVLNIVIHFFAILVMAVCSMTFFMFSGQAFAQTTGGINKAKTALTTVTSDISGLFELVSKFMFAIAAICALVGAFIVYSKWNSGDQQSTKLAAAWFGSGLFLLAAGIFIKAIFL